MTNRIVVGVDGSEGAALALQFAVQEGQVHDAPVAAVMTWGFLDQHHPVDGPTFDPSYDATAASTALRSYLDEALGREAAATVVAQPVLDLPAPGLLAAAEDAKLLVVGGRGMGGFKALMLGSVSAQCLHHAPCPVAVVHRGWDPAAAARSGRVVVAVDGSANSHDALAWAAREAGARGAQLEVVSAWSVPDAGGFPFAGVTFDPAPFEERAQAVLRAALAGLEPSDLAPAPTSSAVQGPAAAAILDHAKDADLVVVGSRGLGGFKGLLLGSVAQQVSRHSTCPVVVVPSRS